MSVNALQLNTGARIVIESGLERVSPVQEPATVPWTAIGILGLDGVPVLSLVVEEKKLDFDSVTWRRGLCWIGRRKGGVQHS